MKNKLNGVLKKKLLEGGSNGDFPIIAAAESGGV